MVGKERERQRELGSAREKERKALIARACDREKEADAAAAPGFLFDTEGERSLPRAFLSLSSTSFTLREF